MTNEPETDLHVRQLLGEALIKYVFNGEEWDAADDSVAINKQTKGALRDVVAEAMSTGETFQTRHILGALLSLQQGGAPSLVNQLRLLHGGAIPTAASDDPLTEALCDLALVAFPISLLPPEPDNRPFGLSMDLSSIAWGHPSFQALNDALLQDPAIKTLFPAQAGTAIGHPQSDLTSVRANLIWSSGRGGTLQLVMVASSALQYVFARMRLNGDLDVNSVPERVRETVSLMRNLARDRRAQVPMVVSLGNVSLAPGLDVNLPFGRIVGTKNLIGYVPSVENEATAALVLDVELRLLDVLPSETAPADDQDDLFARRWKHHQPAMTASQQAVSREVVRSRLALALASDDDNLIAPIVRASAIIHPLTGGTGSWAGSLVAVPYGPAFELDRSRAIQVEAWGARLRAYPDSMWMGARRLLSAMAERVDPLDGFIDAVVCWENMLGAETEVTFRVCAGLALLLEPVDPTARLQTFKELQALYRDRSGLVHGSREPAPEVASRHRDRAVRVAIAAIRAIFDRPALLEAVNSSERNRRLMLGA